MLRSTVVITATALTLAACSSSGSGSGGTTVGAGTSVTVSVAHGTLVAPNGHTLYANTADSAKHLICTGHCLQIWPPLLGTPTAGAGVSSTSLGTIKRGSGTQITFDGHPLYEFDSDSAPGDMKGNGVSDAGGTWHPIGSGAHQVGGKPAPSTGHAPATGGGGGYGGYP